MHAPGTHSPAITSLTNPRVKAAVRLRDRRERDDTGLTLVDGARELLRALDAGVEVREAFVCEPLARSADAITAVDRLAAARVPCWTVTEAVLAKVGFGERAEGVVAILAIPNTDLGAATLPSDPLVLVAEGIEKPGNLGAILRAADGAGADAVIAASPRTDLFNPSAIRASLGAIFALRLARASSGAVRGWLVERGLRIMAARVDGAALATDVDLRGPLAIVVGTEADGLSSIWTGPEVEAVRLPMLGVGDSLNVAAASAVLLYEARRQRGVPAQIAASARQAKPRALAR